MTAQKDVQGFYKSQGAITDPKGFGHILDNLPSSIPKLCTIVHGVITHRDSSELYGLELSEQRKQEGETRYVFLILKRISELDSNPLSQSRLPEKRFAGTCRDFAILLCAMLRRQGVPARLRCGFAAYFTKGRYEDHWVCEYWDRKDSRWVLVDAEIDDVYQKKYDFSFDVHDIPRDQFLTAAEAWQGCITGKFDPNVFGVSIIDIQGMWFVRNDVVRDLAALNKIEVLPWDEWGIAEKEYDKLAKEELSLLDKVAHATSPTTENFEAIQKLYEDERLKIQGTVRSFTTYGGEKLVKLDI